MATDNNGFQIVGPKQISAPVLSEQTKHRLPSVSFAILGMIVLGCLLANVIATKDPSYMDLMNYTKAPNREFLFGRIILDVIFFHVSGMAAGSHSQSV